MKNATLILLSMAISASLAACGAAPVESDNSSAQRSRADKAQSELGAEATKQRSAGERVRKKLR